MNIEQADSKVTLESLKTEGYVIKFNHARCFSTEDEFLVGPRSAAPDLRPDAKGGATFCRIEYDGAIAATGIAYCSLNDNFNRKMGRDISLGRAVADLTGVAEIRAARREGLLDS